MGVEFCLEIFGSGGTFGPSTRLAEVWDARNLGWSRYDRLAAKGFATLAQASPLLSLFVPLTTHVKMTRVAPSGNTEVYAGAFIDYDSTGDDVVLDFYDYLSLLSVSRSGYRVLYPGKTIKEVVDAEWALARGAASSPLGFVATGTTETPVGQDGVTTIKMNAEFGLLDQTRLQVFYDLSEMGRANTANHVTFEITRVAPYTFNFWKAKGSDVGLGLVLGGLVSDYRYLPGWTQYRNDLATLGTTVGGGATEIVKRDTAEITARGLRQDVATIKTLLGITGAATEADQQQAAAARLLTSKTKQQPALLLRLMRGLIEPFSGFDIADKVVVEIANGIDTITGRYRIVGIRGIYNEEGEDTSLIVQPVLT